MSGKGGLLFVGATGRGQTSGRRAELFGRDGWDVIPVGFDLALDRSSPVERQLALRLQFGPMIRRYNEDILVAAEAIGRGSAAFFDKPVFVEPNTLLRLRELGVRTVSYMPDDPFGPRKDGLWRLFTKVLPLFDVHIVPRFVTAEDFRARGAREVLTKHFGFDPRYHWPEQPPRTRFELGYSYIGFPHEHRPEFLLNLKQALEPSRVRLSVFGPGWHSWRRRLEGEKLQAKPALWDEDYRAGIWNSLACLAFVTRMNRDEISHKAIEIAACGRPPVLEPAPAHMALFKDGESAIFFSSAEECAEKLLYYSDRIDDVQRMGRAAAARVREAGYSEADLIALADQALRP